jgi:hypothetical protein
VSHKNRCMSHKNRHMSSRAEDAETSSIVHQIESHCYNRYWRKEGPTSDVMSRRLERGTLCGWSSFRPPGCGQEAKICLVNSESGRRG